MSAEVRLKAMIANGARIVWEVPHARTRALERHISLFEAERVIRGGNVTEEIVENGRERWQVSGLDTDLRSFDVVVSPANDGRVIRVITLTRPEARRGSVPYDPSL
jgi:uncharacterized DUF497 family protein